jgi:hypothetical protein
VELERKGPGLLLRDILKGEDAQVRAVAQVIAAARADIILLQGVDYDHGQAALSALRDRVTEAGLTYPYLFSLRPNTGRPTDRDIDGDSRLGEPEDAHGYGWFSGEGGMAILSRHPIRAQEARDFSNLLWRDLPGAIPPAGAPYLDVLRLASVGIWAVPVDVGTARLTLGAFHATPPVFDGPEDRNGRRNHDELAFWRLYLDGAFGPAPKGPFVLAGHANLDPVDGEGRRDALLDLLGDPRLQDPAPSRAVVPPQRFGHRGDPALDTVEWAGPEPGARRVSYILPARDLRVIGAGILAPDPATPLGAAVEAASRHRLTWVEIDW